MLESNQTERERRVFERVLLRCPVKFKPEKENQLNEGSAKDFSDGGVGLFTRSKLEQNMCLEIWINLSPQIKPLHMNGRVIWVDKKRPDLWRAGICFNEMAFIKVVKILLGKNLK